MIGADIKLLVELRSSRAQKIQQLDPPNIRFLLNQI